MLRALAACAATVAVTFSGFAETPGSEPAKVGMFGKVKQRIKQRNTARKQRRAQRRAKRKARTATQKVRAQQTLGGTKKSFGKKRPRPKTKGEQVNESVKQRRM